MAGSKVGVLAGRWVRLGCTLLLTSCGSGLTNDPTGLGAAGAPPAGELARVFLGSCLNGPELQRPRGTAAFLLPLAGAIAGQFASATLDVVGKALQAAATPKTAAVLAIGYAPPLATQTRLGPPTQCLQIVVGRFQTTEQHASSLDHDLNKLQRQVGIELLAPPTLLMEWEVKPSLDGTAIALQQTRERITKLLPGAGLSGLSGERDQVVTIFFSPVDKKPTEGARFDVPIESVSAGVDRTYRLGLNDGPVTLLQPIGKLSSGSFNIVALVAQTSAGVPFLAALGDALVSADAKTAATAAAIQAVNPAARQQAELAQQDKDSANRTAALTLLNDTLAAISDANACLAANDNQAGQCQGQLVKAHFQVDSLRARFTTLHYAQPTLPPLNG